MLVLLENFIQAYPRAAYFHSQVSFTSRRVEDYAMGGEIINTALLAFTLVLIGMGLGFFMLKVQGGEE